MCARELGKVRIAQMKKPKIQRMKKREREEEGSQEAQNQCDQMARLFFNLWPFMTMKICPVA